MKDNSNVYGELNSNAKLFAAEIIGESLTIIHGEVKTLDSASFCIQRDDFQVSCEDPGCPRCNSKTLAVPCLKGTTIVALVAKDLIARLPHVALDEDGIQPQTYREKFYGNFPFSTLNRRDFRDRRGIHNFNLAVIMLTIVKKKVIQDFNSP